MQLELSPTHPMHKGLCRGHGGLVMLVLTGLFRLFTLAQV